MKNTGTLRIQTFAARQSAPVEGVTVAVHYRQTCCCIRRMRLPDMQRYR